MDFSRLRARFPRAMAFLFSLPFVCAVPRLVAQEGAVYPSEKNDVTIQAIRLSEPLHLDGKLDEEIYRTAPPITKFVQQLPNSGQPATDRSEAWVLFDDTAIYVACRCWMEFPDRIVANDMRRDSANITSQDHFEIGRAHV